MTRWSGVPRPIRFAIVATTLLAFVLVATGLIALLSARPALAASSTLTVLGGTVAVREGGGEFAAAQDGQLVGPGMTIRTGPGANAVLTYIDGSTVTIEPDSELVIEQLEVSAAGDLVAVVKQSLGRTWHVVASKLGPTGRYEVRAPAATAAVRGTAFQFTVLTDGGLDLTTVDGIVATTGGGATVDVNPGQITSVPLNAPPTQPVPAPEPQALVRITLSPTSNGVAVDQNGRSVGVQNGQALRYAPGSKVELINGQLVLTIPTNEPGRISTIVKPDATGPQGPVQIQTQIVSNGNVVANTVEQRGTDSSGTARGGVVLTTTGVIVLPDGDAKLFRAPIIGKTPDRPTQDAPRPTPLITARPTPSATPQPSGTPPPPAAAFLGGFQAFGTAATAGALVRFTGEVPKELLPPPPPSKDGCPAFSTECTRLRFVPDPSPSAVPAILRDFGFIPKDTVLPSGGPTVFLPRGPVITGTSSNLTQPIALPPGCEQTVFGLICKAETPPQSIPQPGSTLPPDFGTRPVASPTGAPGFVPVPLPIAPPFGRTACPEGTIGTPPDCRLITTAPTVPIAPLPTCEQQGLVGIYPACLRPSTPPPPASSPPPTCEQQGLVGIYPACTKPSTPPPPASSPPPTCEQQGLIGIYPACSRPSAPPPATKTCLLPTVLLPDGSCGIPSTPAPEPTPKPTPAPSPTKETLSSPSPAPASCPPFPRCL